MRSASGPSSSGSSDSMDTELLPVFPQFTDVLPLWFQDFVVSWIVSTVFSSSLVFFFFFFGFLQISVLLIPCSVFLVSHPCSFSL